MVKGKRLGRGLNALLADEPTDKNGVQDVSLGQIVPNPYQPRRSFPDDALAELAASIRAHGVVQPIILRPQAHGTYSLIAGERRFRAAQLAGLTSIPALVRDYDDRSAEEVALVENLQREDLNPVEEGEALAHLMEAYGYTQEQVAGIIGKSRPYVANLLRLRALPADILALLARGELTIGQVRPLLALSSEKEQQELARRIARDNLSARQAEDLVRGRTGRREAKPRPADPAAAYFHKMEEELKLALGTGVRIRNGKGKNSLRGAITIEYNGEKEFQRIIAFLKNEEI